MIKKPKYKCRAMLQNDFWKTYYGDIGIYYFSYDIKYSNPNVCIGIIGIYQIKKEHWTTVKPEYIGPSIKCPENFKYNT